MDTHDCLDVLVYRTKLVEYCNDCSELKKMNFKSNCIRYPNCLEQIEVPDTPVFRCLYCDREKEDKTSVMSRGHHR